MRQKLQEPKNRRTKAVAALVLGFFGAWFFGSVLPAAEPPVAVHLDDEPPPLRLGHRAANDLPPLTDDELGTAQQQALLTALAGDPHVHRADEHACAGCSMLIRPHAICSNTAHYGGYWVGGGIPCRREMPFVGEGTFGWDYFGVLVPKRIALNWSHGRRYQGGSGAYMTDGPRLK